MELLLTAKSMLIIKIIRQMENRAILLVETGGCYRLRGKMMDQLYRVSPGLPLITPFYRSFVY